MDFRGEIAAMVVCIYILWGLWAGDVGIQKKISVLITVDEGESLASGLMSYFL
jgi:hypothetical protein